MKKNLMILFIIMFMSAVMAPVTLFCQEEEEEEEPVQARPDPRTWAQLKEMSLLKSFHIKELQKGQVFQFDLRNIKQAIIKAKIREKVTIEYVDPNGKIFPLGTYAATRRATRLSQRAKGIKSGKNRRYINPQPEPPGVHKIPFSKQVAISAAVKMASTAQKGKALLIFKNAAGQIKATIQLPLGEGSQL